MSYLFGFMFVFGLVLFSVGVLTRTYMNLMIKQSDLPSLSGIHTTELRYRYLIKERGGLAIECYRHMSAARNPDCFCSYHLE